MSNQTNTTFLQDYFAALGGKDKPEAVINQYVDAAEAWAQGQPKRAQSVLEKPLMFPGRSITCKQIPPCNAHATH